MRPGTVRAQRHGHRQEADRLIELRRLDPPQVHAQVMIDPEVVGVGVLGAQQLQSTPGRTADSEGLHQH